MLKSLAALVAVLALAVSAQAQFTQFRDIGFHGHVSIEVRMGRPVIVVVNVDQPGPVVSWHPSQNPPWPLLGAQVALREIAVLDPSQCLDPENSVMLFSCDLCKLGECGPMPNPFAISGCSGSFFPTYRDHGNAWFVYCNRWEPASNIYEGPCGGNCFSGPSPYAYAAVFDIRVL